MGRPGTAAANKVHLIDFGMARRYLDPKTQEHIPYAEKQPPLGTPRYMSINTHLGREQSRRDDLETLCYAWLYFQSGSLPWQGIKATRNEARHTKIGEKKGYVTVDDLCAGLPGEFAECLRYVRGLGFKDRPDYDRLQELLSRVLVDAGEVDDGVFDWMEAREDKRWELEMRPPPGTIGSNAGPSAPLTAKSMARKRDRTDSVPDPEQSRARRLPAPLRGIAAAADIEKASGYHW